MLHNLAGVQGQSNTENSGVKKIQGGRKEKVWLQHSSAFSPTKIDQVFGKSFAHGGRIRRVGRLSIQSEDESS